jgi:hypothetical protein
MNAYEEFWEWFTQRQNEIFEFEADQERVFDLLAAALQKVDSHLTFEFGPKGRNREFVISAGGIKSAFPAVISLVDAAPPLDRWKITAFRPRRTPPDVVEFGGKQARPRDVQFSLLDNGKIAGLRLFIPSFQEDDPDWKQVGYLLLDDTLGEYDVESRLGLIKMYSPDARNAERRYPLADLPSAFDQLLTRLEGRSGKPS